LYQGVTSSHAAAAGFKEKQSTRRSRAERVRLVFGGLQGRRRQDRAARVYRSGFSRHPEAVVVALVS